LNQAQTLAELEV